MANEATRFIKSFSINKGYGFIVSDVDDQRNIFYHITQVAEESEDAILRRDNCA